MTIPSFRTKGFALMAFWALGLFAAIAGACAAGARARQNPAPSKNGAAAPAAQPKIDPAEQAAYKAFYDADPQDSAKKIQLGEDFVQKYPASRYTEGVYASLVQLYLTKQDLDKFYAAADKALALNPDDASVLTTVGWVIPHAYDPNSLDAEKNLAKAETYEKHSIEVLGAMPKPANMTDQQFASSKAEDLSQAHSGLGLVYFRRQQYDDSSKELKQAIEASAQPDPTDLYIMGIDLQNLKLYPDAADAFNRCAQIPGGLQDECKSRADAAKKQAK